MEFSTGKPWTECQEWSDAEIRKALLAHGESSEVPITSTTRPLLLRKLERLQGQPAQKDAAGKEVCSESSSNHQEGGYLQEDPIEGYYGVIGRHLQPSVELSPFYTRKSEVLKAVKGVPGARFKRFDSQQGAEAFSRQRESAEEGVLHSQDQSTITTSERANSFPRPKVQDLSSLRKLIETGTVEDFVSTVWDNPRTLITSGDAPEILQEGFRYNALHCAVSKGRLDMCQKLIEVIQSNRFWELVYPNDSEAIRAERKSHLLDMYLNVQDKINNETPLHFASKRGHEQIVAYLMSFPQTSTSIQNRYGETPGDVAGRNAKTCTVGLKERIKQLLRASEGYFVPVLRAVDNSTPPQLGTPCTWEDYLLQEEVLSDDSGTPIVGQAFAGPMSPSEAQEFYQEWKSPRGRRAYSLVKRSDPTKGWERVGRSIAFSNKVDWTEYWDFLGCYCDLSKREGVQRLEEHLASQASFRRSSCLSSGSPTFAGQLEEQERPLCRTETEDTTPCNLTRELFPKEDDRLVGAGTGTDKSAHSKPSHHSNLDHPDSAVSDLAESLASLDLSNECREATDIGPADRLPSPASGLVTPVKRSSTLTTGDAVFLTGPQPTKADYDALLAVSESEADPQDHPHAHAWLTLIKSYSELEQKSWRTPLSDRRHHSFKINRSLPMSPLVFSPPPPSPQHTPILHRSHTPKRHMTNHPHRVLTPKF